MLDETDQERYAEAFEPYLKGKAGQYAYRVKPGESGAHLERIGQLMHQLVEELADRYGDEHSYPIKASVSGRGICWQSSIRRLSRNQSRYIATFCRLLLKI
jgi:hypothetical protein